MSALSIEIYGVYMCSVCTCVRNVCVYYVPFFLYLEIPLKIVLENLYPGKILFATVCDLNFLRACAQPVAEIK